MAKKPKTLTEILLKGLIKPPRRKGIFAKPRKKKVNKGVIKGTW